MRTGWDFSADAIKHGLGAAVTDWVYLLATRQTSRPFGNHNWNLYSNHWACFFLARDYAAVGILAPGFADAVPEYLARDRIGDQGVEPEHVARP